MVQSISCPSYVIPVTLLNAIAWKLPSQRITCSRKLCLAATDVKMSCTLKLGANWHGGVEKTTVTCNNNSSSNPNKQERKKWIVILLLVTRTKEVHNSFSIFHFDNF